jgi:endonuclease/exonuclease/phosphatase family metal-dependent hydrolase
MALLSPAGVAQSTPRPELTVMTRNLYLGSSLTPALVATDPGSFLGAVATIYGTAQSTNFPARAEALADEIETHLPDLVGLQEVTRWETSGPGVPPTQDFLSILTGELAERGLDYTVASVANNANIGPIPLATPCVGPFGSCLVTLKDRDVILVNAGREGLTWRSPRSGNFTAQQVFTPPVPGAAPVSFNRGWTSIDGRYQGKSFRFVNTHFETEDFQEVQEAQAAEFLAGPARGGQVIAVGDFNSAADGSTTTSYAQLTAPPAFTDAWTVNHGDLGLTCCQNARLTNETSVLGSRIDLILTRGPIRPISAKVVGDVKLQVQQPPFWASDHAGVVARVRIR